MAEKPSGSSSFETSIAMKNSESVGQDNVSSSSGVTGSGEDLLPMGGKAIEVSFLGNTEATFPKADIGDAFSFTKSGVFSGSITKDLEGALDHHVTASAKGDQGIKLETLGQGDRVAPPTTSEVHAKIHGLRGGGEGREG